MTVIARVTSQDPQLMLAPLLTAPLGLDVWEVKPDHVVLQASEAQIERLEQMGYGVEQLHMTRRTCRHSQRLRQPLAITQRSSWSRICGLWPNSILILPNFVRSGAASRTGRSGRCGSVIVAAPIARCSCWVVTMPESGSLSRCRICWPSISWMGRRRPGAAVAAARRDLGGADGQPGWTRVQPHRQPAMAQEPPAKRRRKLRRGPQP